MNYLCIKVQMLASLKLQNKIKEILVPQHSQRDDDGMSNKLLGFVW